MESLYSLKPLVVANGVDTLQGFQGGAQEDTCGNRSGCMMCCSNVSFNVLYDLPVGPDILYDSVWLLISFIQGITFQLDEEMAADDDEREALQEIINNTKLSEGYLTLARDIEVMEPKSPVDIYKAHLLDGRASLWCKC
ncbi:hypothetical protein LOK49_Contig36G00009 [Camellia lanceoleosa]|nr:hypothetical protein LOK49_Contig36G00009 [Camellia lanceoleosa]